MTTLTFLTAGCVPGQATPSDMPNDADTAMEEQAEEKLEFNEEYADFLYGGTSIGTLQQNSPYGWSGVPEGIHDLSINSVEEDRHGKYTRVKVSLRDDYIDSIPLEYVDFDFPMDMRTEPTTTLRPIEDLSEEEVREALRFFADFVLNETLDSIALDNPYRYEEWLDTVGAQHFSPIFLEKARANFDPFVGSNPCGEEGFWGYVCEVHGPPQGNFSDDMAAAPGLVHLSGHTTFVEVEYEGELSGAAWGETSIPMLRDGGSRSGVRHLYHLHMEERGTGAFPNIYIFTRFHFRTVQDGSLTDRNPGGIVAPSRSGYLGYTLIKIDGEWKIHDSSPVPQTGMWSPRSAFAESITVVDHELIIDGPDPRALFPEWANSSREERPELRYPEVTQ